MTNSSTTMKALIQEENTSNTVVIYSKSYCPFCMQAKALFNHLPNVQVKVHEMDLEDDGALMQRTLYQMTGQRTVPNIFVNNQHVGGNDDVQDANVSGELQKWLSNAKKDEAVVSQ
mmetsp:Transcript_105/g.223  ORF Transcript_105/g.223 Transcript_105/m.223 type:complete len:116 (-) Transcript_105:75-422(-)|eukprot:CAMPEP_0168726972 /NCGR_PEP_ID=MMETSP0724-20121128/4941_1 /TAXON_ID=265536 /ORGANISM="Amphiprora sp., Strain CCMP467" /LENGTH=115 /DNA_ID=CAMNT_0008773797 /DNA_START=31 /DNA_END=378 /DNA_ORIENTATION=-